MEERGLTSEEAVRRFAADRRVFSKAQLVAAVGKRAAEAVGRLVDKGRIERHAVGIYAIEGTRPDDQRIVDLVRETGARPLSDEAVEQRRRINEDRRAAELGAVAPPAGMPITDRVMDRFAEQPIATVSEIRKAVGVGASGALTSLAAQGRLMRINAGLYAIPSIDPLGNEMAAYVERHSVELADVKREIDTARQLLASRDAGSGAVTYKVYRIEGQKTRVYVDVDGMPAIYAQRKRRKPDVSIGWYGSKESGLSPLAAEHVARMVFGDDLPDDIGDFIDLVQANGAPGSIRRRAGVYRAGPHDHGEAEYGQGYEPPPASRGYGPSDTAKLDPTRLSSPLPETVRLEIDDREDDYLITRLTGVENLSIIRTRLAIGDFRATHGGREIVFERKTTDDLIASMADGRLTNQVRAMSEAGVTSCFVVEGGLFGSRGQPLPRLAAMQTRLVYGMNMRILETIDMTHTAYAITVAIRDYFFGCEGKFDLEPVRLPGIGPIEIAKVMLETIPSISPTRSAALIRRFGSLAGVARASAKEIAEIDGIGATTAKRLHEVLHAGMELLV